MVHVSSKYDDKAIYIDPLCPIGVVDNVLVVVFGFGICLKGLNVV